MPFGRVRAARRRNNQPKTRRRRVARRKAPRNGLGGTDIRTMFFKDSLIITVQGGNLAYQGFLTTDINQNGQYGSMSNLYKEYKVLWMGVRFIPTGPFGVTDRGTTMTRVDQTGDSAQPTTIGEIITDKAVRIQKANLSSFSRWIARPSGHPEWTDITVSPATNDNWTGLIDLFNQNNGMTTGVELFYAVRTFKVAFRGRQ